MTQIFTNAPVWIWPLLVGLIIVGLRATRARLVPVGLIYALPLLVALPLRTVAALGAGTWIWGIFALAFGIGAWGGYLVQRGWVRGFEGRRVQIAGEYLTLVVLMVIFWANFISGFANAVAPQIAASGWFHAAFATVIAASSGSFAGRALRTLRLRRGGHAGA